MDRYSALDDYANLMQGGYEYTNLAKDVIYIIDKVCSKSNFLKMNRRAGIEGYLELIDDGFDVIKRERQKLKEKKYSRLRKGIEIGGLVNHLLSWIPILNLAMFLSPNMRNAIRDGRLSVKDYDMLLDLYERRLKENKAYMNKRLQTTLKESFASVDDYYEAVMESMSNKARHADEYYFGEDEEY